MPFKAKNYLHNKKCSNEKQPQIQPSISVALDLVDRQEAILNKIIQAKDQANDAMIAKIQQESKEIIQKVQNDSFKEMLGNPRGNGMGAFIPKSIDIPKSVLVVDDSTQEIVKKINDNNQKITDLKKAKKKESKAVKFERLSAGKSSVKK